LTHSVAPEHLYQDEASGKRDDRLGLEACLKALREGDTLYIWKLDRLGRDLKHLVTTVRTLSDRGVGLSVLTGQGANIDTTTSSGKLIFGIFAALAEFEGDIIRERTMAGLAAARARGRHGGRKFELTKNQIRLAQSAMANRDTHVAQLCRSGRRPQEPCGRGPLIPEGSGVVLLKVASGFDKVFAAHRLGRAECGALDRAPLASLQGVSEIPQAATLSLPKRIV
jgi:hypothetical protein